VELEHAREMIIELLIPQLAQCGKTAGDLSGDTDLVQTGVVDSIAFIDLIVALERKTGVEMDLFDTDPSEFVTLDGLASQVLRYATP
jgi:acyl carrier protein